MNTLTRRNHVRHGVLRFAVTLAMITYVDRVCISQAAPFMQKELGLTDFVDRLVIPAGRRSAIA